MSKRLATINTNVPIDEKFSDFLLKEPDYDKLIGLYTKLEFNSFLKKLKIDVTHSSRAVSRKRM